MVIGRGEKHLKIRLEVKMEEDFEVEYLILQAKIKLKPKKATSSAKKK